MELAFGPQLPKRASQWYMPCTFSAITSDSNPCAREESSWPPTTIEGREVRMPAEVAVAPAAMKSVRLQAMLALLPLVHVFLHLLYLVLGTCIPALRRLCRRWICRLRRNFHVIDHYCHFISFALADLRTSA